MSVRMSPDPTVITVGLGGLKRGRQGIVLQTGEDHIDISLSLLICRSSFVRDTYNRGIEDS